MILVDIYTLYNLALTQYTFNETVAKAEAQLHISSAALLRIAKVARFSVLFNKMERDKEKTKTVDQIAFHIQHTKVLAADNAFTIKYTIRLKMIKNDLFIPFR